jgi:hypothetical protein
MSFWEETIRIETRRGESIERSLLSREAMVNVVSVFQWGREAPRILSGSENIDE